MLNESHHWQRILFTLGCLYFASSALAEPPANLEEAKKLAIRYHDSGQYEKDLQQVASDAINYLNTRVGQPVTPGKQPAIVLDIDETSLSNYADMRTLNFGGTDAEILAYENRGTDPAIQPILQVYQFAQAHRMAVFFLTGRAESQRQATTDNLKQAGYTQWARLILRNKHYATAPAAIYKTAMRKQITEAGYNILINIGDQESDLKGGYAEKTFKLPNPYYFIP